MIQLIKLKIMLFEAAKVRNFQNLSTFAGQNRTRSLMDKIKDSGSLAQGSIPCGFTKNQLIDYRPIGFSLFYTNCHECITNFQKLNSWVIYSVKSTIS